MINIVRNGRAIMPYFNLTLMAVCLPVVSDYNSIYFAPEKNGRSKALNNTLYVIFQHEFRDLFLSYPVLTSFFLFIWNSRKNKHVDWYFAAFSRLFGFVYIMSAFESTHFNGHLLMETRSEFLFMWFKPRKIYIADISLLFFLAGKLNEWVIK